MPYSRHGKRVLEDFGNGSSRLGAPDLAAFAVRSPPASVQKGSLRAK